MRSVTGNLARFHEVSRQKWVLMMAFALHEALPPHLSAGILLLAGCPMGDMANWCPLRTQSIG
jgi:predicted Na+-dependent transporter